MNRKTRTAALAAVLLLPLAVAGCGNDAPNGDKVAFCKLNAEIDSVLDTVKSEDEAFAAFAKVLPTMDRGVQQAPDVIKPDVQKAVAAVRHGLEIKDLSALSTPALDDASENIKHYCA